MALQLIRYICIIIIEICNPLESIIIIIIIWVVIVCNV